jgi:hypothetical protein
MLLANSMLYTFRATDICNVYLLPSDCISVGYSVCCCLSDMIRLMTIYILSEIVDASKLLYFYNSKLSLMMATIISRNMSEKR